MWKHWLALSELLGCLSSHYEAQVKWNKRRMSNEHGSFVGVQVPLPLPCDSGRSTGALTSARGWAFPQYREACLKELWKKIARMDEK